MNILHFHFILLNSKIFGEIVISRTVFIRKKILLHISKAVELYGLWRIYSAYYY